MCVILVAQQHTASESATTKTAMGAQSDNIVGRALGIHVALYAANLDW